MSTFFNKKSSLVFQLYTQIGLKCILNLQTVIGMFKTITDISYSIKIHLYPHIHNRGRVKKFIDFVYLP